MSTPRWLTLAHSADADDAFMFQPLLDGTVAADHLRFKSVISDIETLNEAAEKGTFDVTALSLHGYAFVQKKYRPLSAGASAGDGYGPILVSKKPLRSLRGRSVAVPGLRTTACLLLRLFEPDCRVTVVPFDRILDAVRSGEAEAGLVIHEGQITYREHGLRRVADLGEWWHKKTNLPAVLGIVAAKRSHPAATLRAIQDSLKASVASALRRPSRALDAAAVYSRGMRRATMKRFVDMYVNEFTVDLGDRGRRSAGRMLAEAFERRLIPAIPRLDFVE